MDRAYHRWDSPALNRPMELLIFGYGGLPYLVFPTSNGRFYEFEDNGMVAALRDRIERGELQLFCVDGIYAETWFNTRSDIDMRMWREEHYERYLINEALPLVRHTNSEPFLIATGCEFGATEAVHFAFRHPDLVNRVIGLHGNYDLGRYANYHTESRYLHNPMEFLPNLRDEQRLSHLREMDIVLVTSEDDPGKDNNQRLSQILWDRQIWHALRIWSDGCYGWEHWQRMIGLYIDGSD